MFASRLTQTASQRSEDPRALLAKRVAGTQISNHLPPVLYNQFHHPKNATSYNIFTHSPSYDHTDHPPYSATPHLTFYLSHLTTILTPLKPKRPIIFCRLISQNQGFPTMMNDIYRESSNDLLTLAPPAEEPAFNPQPKHQAIPRTVRYSMLCCLLSFDYDSFPNLLPS